MTISVPKYGEYGEGNFWFQRKLSLITIGITNQALDEIGNVHSVELPEEGDDFSKGDAVVTIQGNQGKLEVIIPASGVIQEINTLLTTEPEVVGEDPTEDGWLVKIQVQDTSDLIEYADED